MPKPERRIAHRLNPQIAALSMPRSIRALPVDARGFPVPWFVAWVDGEPEFRAMDYEKFKAAIREKRCWVCGEKLGQSFAFLIGSMCAVNRATAEPPSHDDCARFSVRGCPFLSRPGMRRRTNDLPENIGSAGVMIERNPGVICLWTTRSYGLIKQPNGTLLRVGDPERVRWYAEGRAATRAEVEASIDSGLPALAEIAESQGPGAVAALAGLHRAALVYLPAAAPNPEGT
jgi:hypothetical protein